MKNPTLKLAATLAIAFCIALTLDLWSQDNAGHEPAATQQSWQHLALAHPSDKEWNDKELAQQINRLGREGWEMFNVLNFSKDGTTKNTIYYFKKPM
ncbi:MAG: hypothetical protein ACR2RV_26205 [Verrucomicrobiales bacterium]